MVVITFSMSATGGDQTMKQLGIGLGAAILIDVEGATRVADERSAGSLTLPTERVDVRQPRTRASTTIAPNSSAR